MVAAILAAAVVAISVPSISRERPVMVNNKLIDPSSGRCVRVLHEASEYGTAEPVPGLPGRFEVEAERRDGTSILVDASTRSVVEVTAPTARTHDDVLSLLNSRAQQVWQATLPGPGGTHGPSEALIGRGLVVAAYEGGVAAYAIESGRRVWVSPGINDRLCLWRDLLLAAQERFMVARRLSDGSETWRVEIWAADEPEPIKIVGDHALIRTEPHLPEKNTSSSLFVDVHGHVTLRLNEVVYRAWPWEDGWVILTGKRFARIHRDGTTLWEHEEKRWRAGLDGLIHGEALYTYAWERRYDSAVRISRINMRTGEIVWNVACEPLRVPHSRYSQDVYVELRGDKLIVVSQGSSGSFVEVLSVKDGRHLDRWRY